MTDKPKLSVERELIQRIADHCKFWIDHPYLEAIADVEVELRAILDKPADDPNLGIEMMRGAGSGLLIQDHGKGWEAVTFRRGVRVGGFPLKGGYKEIVAALDAFQQQGEPVALLSKGFTTLESEGGKYRIITAYENRDDAWEDYKELCNAEQPYSAVIAELKAELEKYKAGCVDLSSQVRELEHKMDFYRNDEVKEELEAYKVAFEEGKKAAMYHSGTTLMTYMEVMGKLQRDIIRERKEKGA